MSGAAGPARPRVTSDPVVLQGVAFSPRGGSAHVVRSLARALPESGWAARIVAGSVGQPGDAAHAATFYSGLPITVADFTPALDAWRRGENPLDQPVPLHASYEDRPGAPDPVLAAVPPSLAARQEAAWFRVLVGERPLPPAVLHLHHLTPLHDAARRAWADVPVVTHLHGTELMMLERIETVAADPSWPYAAYWAEWMRGTALRSGRVLTVSSDQAERAVRLLKLPESRVTVVPNGVDTGHFQRLGLAADERLALLRQWLVDEPRGWDESARPGSIRYSAADLSAFVDAATGQLRPVLLYVGRFTAVKRVSLLVRAYARVRDRLGPVAPLLVWGGHPGEWEGEHPHAVVRERAVEGVFFVGWRDHADLRLGLACADLLVAPSVGEAFGSVYLEAMAAGLPVVATRTGGPPTFLNRNPNRPEGWLIPPDDEDELVEVLVEALTFPRARLARGAAGEELVRRRYSWRAVATQVAEVYDGLGTRPHA